MWFLHDGALCCLAHREPGYRDGWLKILLSCFRARNSANPKDWWDHFRGYNGREKCKGIQMKILNLVLQNIPITACKVHTSKVWFCLFPFVSGCFVKYPGCKVSRLASGRFLGDKIADLTSRICCSVFLALGVVLWTLNWTGYLN